MVKCRRKSTNMEPITTSLRELGVAYPAQRIYQELLVSGELTPRALAVKLRMTRPSVYDHLRELARIGLVSEKDVAGKATFLVSDVRMLTRLLEERRQEIEKAEQDLLAVIPTLQKKKGSVDPKVRFFEGTEGVQNALRDVLWSDHIEMLTYWPYRSMLEQLSEEFLVKFNKRRIANKISLRTVWGGAFKKNQHVWSAYDALVERRIAPKEFVPHMGYAIYGEYVTCIAPAEESFGFTVHSHSFAEMMRAQFELLWRNSKRFPD